MGRNGSLQRILEGLASSRIYTGLIIRARSLRLRLGTLGPRFPGRQSPVREANEMNFSTRSFSVRFWPEREPQK
jgi:hypothetical protein